jgi:hypothetical protein
LRPIDIADHVPHPDPLVDLDQAFRSLHLGLLRQAAAEIAGTFARLPQT